MGARNPADVTIRSEGTANGSPCKMCGKPRTNALYSSSTCATERLHEDGFEDKPRGHKQYDGEDGCCCAVLHTRHSIAPTMSCSHHIGDSVLSWRKSSKLCCIIGGLLIQGVATPLVRPHM